MERGLNWLKIKFKSPLPPSVNDYLGKAVRYNPVTRKYYVQVFETAQAREYKSLMKKIIQREMLDKGWEKTGEFEYIICEVVVFLNQKKRDSDNLFKCLLDGIKEAGAIYDDCMVIPRVEDVLIDSENPRLEITLYISDKRGIFKNEEQLERFKVGNCYGCKRYKRYGERCSALRTALENKISSSIDLKENKCLI